MAVQRSARRLARSGTCTPSPLSPGLIQCRFAVPSTHRTATAHAHCRSAQTKPVTMAFECWVRAPHDPAPKVTDSGSPRPNKTSLVATTHIAADPTPLRIAASFPAKQQRIKSQFFLKKIKKLRPTYPWGGENHDSSISGVPLRFSIVILGDQQFVSSSCQSGVMKSGWDMARGWVGPGHSQAAC